MASNYNWESLNADIQGHAKKKKRTKRTKVDPSPYKRKAKHHYKAGYNTTALEDLLAARGQGNAKNLALQRGKTLVTKHNNDSMRAQTITSKTFDGIDVLDNMVTYDKATIKEPDLTSMAAQFGNYQAASVSHGPVKQNKGILTYRPCPF